jgi:superfamily II DNA helicase RecQ
MAFVAVLDKCRARYTGRAEKAATDVSYCILVKDDGATIVQGLESGLKPEFWNSEGRIEVYVSQGRMVFRSSSRTRESLEIEGIVRSMSNVSGAGYRVQVNDVAVLPALVPSAPIVTSSPVRPDVNAAAAVVRRPAQEGIFSLTRAQRAKFVELKAWRTERSRELGLPAYVLARDDTLIEMARVLPQDLQVLASIKGMGPKRCEQFGQELLEILAR